MTLLQKSALTAAAPLLRNVGPGGQLPPETRIAAHASVGRSVVRSLFRRWAGLGFLSRKGRRWVVRRPLPLPTHRTPQTKKSPLSKKELVKDHLLQELTRGRLQPGERLAELKLARQLCLSTAVVREALLELRPFGAFEKNGRHWMVASLDRERIGHLREFREMVEIFALRHLLASRIPPHVEAALRDNWRRTRELLSDRHVTARRILEVDLEFHRLLLEGTGNPLLPERAGFIYLIIEFQLISPHFPMDRGRFGLRQHLRIHRAIAARNAEDAEHQLRLHLQTAARSFCSIAKIFDESDLG